MNARTKEKTYGGVPIAEIRSTVIPDSVYGNIIRDMLDELEATSAPEVVGRLRRIETKLHKLALHTGAEPVHGGETTMTISASRPLVHVGGYDTTLAQIKHVSDAMGVAPGATLYLLEGESLLGTLRLTGKD